MIRHIGQGVQEKILMVQFLQNGEFGTGNFTVYSILIQIAAGIHQVIFRFLHIRVIGQAVQWIGGAMKTILRAVGLFRFIEAHHKPKTKADQPRLKRFICKHIDSFFLRKLDERQHNRPPSV